jgi:hypothetical protein
LLVTLRLLFLGIESRRKLARIPREHHLEVVRHRAWLLSVAFTAGEGTCFNPGILVAVESGGGLVADIGRRVAISPGVIFVSAASPNASHLLGIPGFAERYVRQGRFGWGMTRGSEPARSLFPRARWGSERSWVREQW